jgi:Putative transposase/Transposase zinc-binding domain
MPPPTSTPPPPPTLADLVRRYAPAFQRRHPWLTDEQRKALRDVARCRTKALGGRTWACAACGHQRVAYRSCRNRHCPGCQGADRAAWLDRELTTLLPTEYFHVVFTLPAAVADLALVNRRIMYDLLFRSAAEAIRDATANAKHLGARVGMTMVLHTWGQTLQHHPHVHAVVTGGGLSCDSKGNLDAPPRWVSCRPGFFIPVKVLGQLFRGKYLAYLKEAHASGQLHFSGCLTGLQDSTAFVAWLRPLYGQGWVVYAKPPFGGPEVVLKYLARYTHRVALGNSRLVSCENDSVTFRYKDYRHESRQKTMTLAAEEFLRRWVQHVLPKGFVKIRHYGLLTNRKREETLTLCCCLLAVLGWVLALVRPSSKGPQWECRECGGAVWLCPGEVEADPTWPIWDEERACDTS